MPRYIVIELLDRTTDAEAQEFAQEINNTFQPHYDAKIVATDERLIGNV